MGKSLCTIMELRRSSLVVFRLILKGILKDMFRLISSLMNSRVILDRASKKYIKWGWDFSCSLHLGHRIFGALPILCIAGFKGREKRISVYQTENIIYICIHQSFLDWGYGVLPGSLTMKWNLKDFLYYLVLLDWMMK